MWMCTQKDPFAIFPDNKFERYRWIESFSERVPSCKNINGRVKKG